MRLNVYSVWDNVAEKYGRPFCCENDKLAIREFSVGIASFSPLIKKDYVLYRIGYFDDEDGIMCSMPNGDFLVLSGEFAKIEDDDLDADHKSQVSISEDN